MNKLNHGQVINLNIDLSVNLSVIFIPILLHFYAIHLHSFY